MENIPPQPPPPGQPNSPQAPQAPQPPYTSPPPGYVPPGQYPPGYQPPPQKGWFGRNCFWFVPVGCLGLIALVVLLGAGIVALVFGALKSTDPYKSGMAHARSSQAAGAALGTPVEDAFYLTGQVNTSGDSGTANLKIPISGPKARGTLHVVGTKENGVWQYSIMQVEVEGTDVNIDLLDAGGG